MSFLSPNLLSQYIYKAKTVKSHPDIFGGTPNKQCSDLGGVPLQAMRQNMTAPNVRTLFIGEQMYSERMFSSSDSDQTPFTT